MPSLSDALVSLEDFNPIESVSRINAAQPNAGSQPIRSTTLRCPLPPLFNPSPDNLRSFYLNSQVPQFRILAPSPVSVGGSTTTTTQVGGSSSGGGGSTTPTILPSVASIQTGVLNPGASFTGQVNMSQSFQLLSLASNSTCRFELYGTAAAQLSDAGRGLDVPPAAGTTQNIICDVALDTAPYAWTFQNRVGANGDSPQNIFAYVTVTNIGAASTAISVTLTYVGLES